MLFARPRRRRMSFAGSGALALAAALTLSASPAAHADRHDSTQRSVRRPACRA
ncbi:hypothetical protein [Streptomyces jumonjinensis]|uniref:hypothetical protein n=1 Tax=Streptomyces jumonjinensis TaxID=1945 RepID=UPI001296D216|nr:hypothetical protein [Streptomyces jumonjinensis]